MIFRAFLTNGLAALFPGRKGQWALALIGSSIIFGLAHYSWGLAGVLETTLLGLVFGSAYLLSGRNLWVTIIAHGLANTLGFILIFSGMA
jgi:membrane protease YdiL (CAAX protease family)